jgi:hypothetical protein
MYFRTLRWKYLLEPVVGVPPRRLFSPLIICFALNSILPGRAGEFARAYLVARDHRAKFSSTLATVIVERMADGLGLLALFVVILALVDFGNISIPWDTRGEMAGSTIILWTTVGLAGGAVVLLALAWLVRRAAERSARGNTPASGLMGLLAKIGNSKRALAACLVLAGLGIAAIVVVQGGWIFARERTYPFGRLVNVDGPLLRSSGNKLLLVCLVMLAGSLLMLWQPFRRFTQAIISGTPLVPRGLKEGLNRFIESFVEGFHSLRSLRLVFWVFVHTATVWLTVGLSLVIMSYGFPPDLHLSFVDGMAVAIIICVAILIPAAPGYWGLYEVGCVLALLVLGVVAIDPALIDPAKLKTAVAQVLAIDPAVIDAENLKTAVAQVFAADPTLVDPGKLNMAVAEALAVDPTTIDTARLKTAIVREAISHAKTNALSFSLVAHFFQIVPVLALGLYFMWRRHIGLSDLAGGETRESQ